VNPSWVRSAVAALLLVCASLAPTARAQNFDAPPQPGAPRPLAIRPPVEQRLPNGLRVVLAERRGVQLVTAQMVVLSGSEVDPTGRAGLASMTAGLLTKGTRRHSATALAQAAESLGGALDSGAGWHQSEVAITVTLPKLDAALALVSEVVRQPVFAPTELDRLRSQALDELKVAYSRPGTLAGLAAQRLLFGSGAYGHPAGGTPASLARIARADLVALHAARYRPDNAVLILAGDLDAGSAMRLARRHFGTWKATGRAAAPMPLRAGAPLAQTTAVIDMAASGQAAVVVAVPLPPLGADRATAAVLNAVLGGSYSSRLNQEVRIRRGLSYGAGSVLDARPGGAALRAVVQTKNESAAEVVGLMQAEIDRLLAAPVAADELAARQASLIGDFSRSVETTAGLGAAVKALIVAGLPLTDLGQRIAALSAVGADAVQRYAVANLGAAGRRVVVAGDAARFVDALKAAAPGLTLVPADRLDVDLGTGLSAR
jgi:zinc protease